MEAHVNEHPHEPLPWSVYISTWAALIVLTGITVGASYLDLKNIAVFVAMLIATTKATLVLLYFMHIRFVRPAYAGMILVVLGTYAIFIGLTFSDYWYR